MVIEIKNAQLNIKGRDSVIHDISMSLPVGAFLVVLGENGAGKTTLLDMLMGFRRPTSGEIRVFGQIPSHDPYQDRNRIAYLSEKVDLPGDWSVNDFLTFNRKFFSNYSLEQEASLIKEFKINLEQRIGNMSAGEVRRVQIAAALAANPELIIIDEITAVLDIIGRHRFMKILGERNKTKNCTVLLATNIVEDLELYASHVGIVENGGLKSFETLMQFTARHPGSSFAQCVAKHLGDL